jgi:hypothetical protein
VKAAAFTLDLVNGLLMRVEAIPHSQATSLSLYIVGPVAEK